MTTIHLALGHSLPESQTVALARNRRIAELFCEGYLEVKPYGVENKFSNSHLKDEDRTPPSVPNWSESAQDLMVPHVYEHFEAVVESLRARGWLPSPVTVQDQKKGTSYTPPARQTLWVPPGARNYLIRGAWYGLWTKEEAANTQIPLADLIRRAMNADLQPQDKSWHDGSLSSLPDYTSGGSHRGSSGGYSTSTSYKKSYAGVIEVMHTDDPEKVHSRWLIDTWDKDYWALVVKSYPVTGALDAEYNNAPVVRVPFSACGFDDVDPPFNACCFTGTEDYLHALWGRRMHTSDKEWLARHPLAEDGGIPQEYMPMAIHQLVEPYGFGVARIRLVTDAFFMGDALSQWLTALGCNPIAMVDHRTTNEEAMAQLGVNAEIAKMLWRVDFGEWPLPGSIIGEKGWTGSGATGAQGGHISYFPPRRRTVGDWFISVQLAPRREIEYLLPLVEPEYKPREGSLKFIMSRLKGPDGDFVATKYGSGWRSPKAQAPTATGGASSTSWGNGSGRSGASSGSRLAVVKSQSAESRPAGWPEVVSDFCYLCQAKYSELEMMPGVELCDTCWTKALEGYGCPHCFTRFTSTLVPDVVGVSHKDTVAFLTCPNPACGYFVYVDPARDEAKALFYHIAVWMDALAGGERDRYIREWRFAKREWQHSMVFTDSWCLPILVPTDPVWEAIANGAFVAWDPYGQFPDGSWAETATGQKFDEFTSLVDPEEDEDEIEWENEGGALDPRQLTFDTEPKGGGDTVQADM